VNHASGLRLVGDGKALEACHAMRTCVIYLTVASPNIQWLSANVYLTRSKGVELGVVRGQRIASIAIKLAWPSHAFHIQAT
jgi:hypothetical protein